MDRSKSPLQHLLVGADFSDHALLVLQEARTLAARLGISLYLVHVIESAGSEEEPINERARRWLSEAGVSLDLLWIRYGRPNIELARAAEQSHAAALVIGSHGRSGFQPLALGSTAARLGLVAPCPVIIINSRSNDRQIGGNSPGQRPQVDPPRLKKDQRHAWLSED